MRLIPQKLVRSHSSYAFQNLSTFSPHWFFFGATRIHRFQFNATPPVVIVTHTRKYCGISISTRDRTFSFFALRLLWSLLFRTNLASTIYLYSFQVKEDLRWRWEKMFCYPFPNSGESNDCVKRRTHEKCLEIIWVCEQYVVNDKEQKMKTRNDRTFRARETTVLIVCLSITHSDSCQFHSVDREAIAHFHIIHSHGMFSY